LFLFCCEIIGFNNTWYMLLKSIVRRYTSIDEE
jgi:hypothetical protein